MRLTYRESPDQVCFRRGFAVGRSAARQLAAITKEIRQIRGIAAAALKRLNAGLPAGDLQEETDSEPAGTNASTRIEPKA